MKQLVAGALAVLVVNGLEIFHIDKRGHEAFARPPRTVHLPLQLLEPEPASARASELVDQRLLAIARGLLAVPQGMPVVEPITAVERERLLVGQGGSLIATRCHPIAVLRRFVPLFCGLVAKMRNLRARPRRPGTHRACVIVGGRITTVIAIPIGGCLVVV